MEFAHVSLLFLGQLCHFKLSTFKLQHAIFNFQISTINDVAFGRVILSVVSRSTVLV